MREINRIEGTAFLFSTHDQHIMEHARRVVRIQDGAIIGDEKRGS
jgi:putative ABC transport system ATP-binding protein